MRKQSVTFYYDAGVTIFCKTKGIESVTNIGTGQYLVTLKSRYAIDYWRCYFQATVQSTDDSSTVCVPTVQYVSSTQFRIDLSSVQDGGDVDLTGLCLMICFSVARSKRSEIV
jgi:hypothetical protein